jgi:opacity protein-like surface antigen
MKRIVIILALVVLSAAAVQAESGIYVKGELAYSSAFDAGLDNERTTATANDDQLAAGSKLDDIGNGTSFGLGFGYVFNQYLRADITGYVRSGYEIDDSSFNGAQKFSGDIDSKAILVNLYAQKELGRFVPYVGVGLGYSKNEIDSFSYTSGGLKGKGPGNDESGFAWQVAAGIGFKLTEKLFLDFEYRYADLGEISVGKGENDLTEFGLGKVDLEGIKGDLRVQEAVLGLRYVF